MRDWWKKKNQRMRKNNRNHEKYSFLDFIVDVLIWVPEIILFPFRLIFWLLRGTGRWIDDWLDII
ncbi:hypothetical protein [Ornithinibacillus salinisoli]|uniref:hypothetical protein n=1 Tax=Ornithinibacillus salinisoli TaxID=1848459 RepID=UPI00366AF279